MARPTKYDRKFIGEIDIYLKENQDEEVQVVKQSNDKKGYEMYDQKLKVRLPTIEGFALFIEINKDTLYEWAKKHDKFSDALEKIRIEQQKRLLNMGLSGEYNSTIAKLILSSNHGMREKSDMTTDGEKLSPVLVKFIDDEIKDNSNT